MANKTKLLAIVVVAGFVVMLGFAWLSSAGFLSVAAKKGKVVLPCVVPEEVKHLVEDVLGDCLDTGGILFERPGVEPLSDPIDGGGVLFSRTTSAVGY